MMPRVRFVISSIALAALLAASDAAKDKTFQVLKAKDYAHQSEDQVTIGAKSFDNEDLTSEAFGKKADLLKYGVLPVLVVVENGRDGTLDLRNLEVNLVSTDGRHVGPTDPGDIPQLGVPNKNPSPTPKINPLPFPLPNKKKNPLNTPEIMTRAFVGGLVPPGDSTSGFFYFQAKPEPGDRIYLNGLHESPSGKQIMYFEFPIDSKPSQ